MFGLWLGEVGAGTRTEFGFEVGAGNIIVVGFGVGGCGDSVGLSVQYL